MKIRNFQALYRFEGYVVEEFICEQSGAQINLRFDKRVGPRCPKCQARLPRNKTGWSVVMDLPVGQALSVFGRFPTVQGLCGSCEHYLTSRPKEVHPTQQSTWRLMRQVSAWAQAAPNTEVAEMFGLSDSSVRKYDKEVRF